MSITRIIIITLLISGSLLMYVLYGLESGSDNGEYEDARAIGSQDGEPSQQAGNQTLPPDPPESAENDEQADKALQTSALKQTQSAKSDERMEAAEQLGAFPGPEMETALAPLLLNDSNAGVRNAAALSLASLDAPSDTTLNGLLNALEDADEEVRLSAVSTLESYLMGLDQASPTYQKIKTGLETKSGSKTLTPRLRDLITEVLRNQQTQQSAPPASSTD